MRFQIAIDFDGTCVTHEYPRIGRDIGAIPVLKKLREEGHDLILFTMRSGEPLQEAVEWLKKQGIDLYGINVNPTQSDWTKSPKAYAQIYIDDAALGCPLIYPKNLKERAYVDWEKVEEWLIEKGIL